VKREFALLVATTKGIFCFWTDRQRRDWEMTGPHLAGWEVYSVLGATRADGAGPKHRIFVGTHHKSGGATIQTSDDFGQTWMPVEDGPRFASAGEFDWDAQVWVPAHPGQQRVWNLNRIWQIAAGAPEEPETFYAGTEEAAVFVSRDGGNVWKELTGLTDHPTREHWGPGAGGMGMHTVLVHPTNPQRIWAAASAVGVFRTDDGGETWKTCNQGLANVPTGTPAPEIGFCAHKIAIDPDDPDTLYMQDHGAVNKSTDGGDSWFRIEEGLGKEGDERFGFPIAISPTGDLFLVPLKSSEDRVMRDGRMVIYRSFNRGESWEPAPGDFVAESHYVNVLRDGLAADTLDPYGVYFGTSSGELFYSLDRGESWGSLPGRFPRITAVKTWQLEA
jgi:hypothetical protein